MRTIAGVALLIVACSSESRGTTDTNSGTATDPDWVRIEASCGYSFEAPPGLTAQPIKGTDSCLDAWTTGSCAYRGDYGAFSSDLAEYQGLPEYKQAQRSIDGRSAKLVTALSEASSVAAVHFREVEPDTGGPSLTVWAECADEAGQQDAVAAFGTIKFAP